jgi:hypothetical protein
MKKVLLLLSMLLMTVSYGQEDKLILSMLNGEGKIKVIQVANHHSYCRDTEVNKCTVKKTKRSANRFGAS